MKLIKGRILIISIIILLLPFTACSPRTCFDPGTIISKNEIRSYSSEAIVNTFLEERELFQSAADMILNNEGIEAALAEQNDDDLAVFLNDDQSYFTTREWKQIVKLFRKTGPYQIMRSMKFGNDVVYYVFLSDVNEDTFRLFYIAENGEQTAAHYKRADDAIRKLDEDWWLLEGGRG